MRINILQCESIYWMYRIWNAPSICYQCRSLLRTLCHNSYIHHWDLCEWSNGIFTWKQYLTKFIHYPWHSNTPAIMVQGQMHIECYIKSVSCTQCRCKIIIVLPVFVLLVFVYRQIYFVINIVTCLNWHLFYTDESVCPICLINNVYSQWI